MAFFTYIMASRCNGTTYVGSTDDLVVRGYQHKAKTFIGFTSKYDIDRLVWFETNPTREAAFRRERQIKKWNRLWKLELIEKANPGWDDLYDRFRLDGLADAEGWGPAFAGMSGKENAED